MLYGSYAHPKAHWPDSSSHANEFALFPTSSREVSASHPKMLSFRPNPQRFSFAIESGPDSQVAIASLCAADGTEFELASHSPHSQVDLNVGEVDDIADAVSPATGLPVRVVIRSKLLNGAVEEVSGMPSASKTGTLMGIGAAVAALPWAAGIFVGWLSPSPAIVIAVGLVLWFCIVRILYLAGRTESPRKNFPALRTLTTLVTFSAAYGVGFVVTAYLRGRL